MSGRGDKADGDDRGGRLAEALRENLRRRKAQARNRRIAPAPRAAGEAADGLKDGPAEGSSAKTGQGGAAEDGRRE